MIGTTIIPLGPAWSWADERPGFRRMFFLKKSPQARFSQDVRMDLWDLRESQLRMFSEILKLREDHERGGARRVRVSATRPRPREPGTGDKKVVPLQESWREKLARGEIEEF